MALTTIGYLDLAYNDGGLKEQAIVDFPGYFNLLYFSVLLG